MRTEASCQSVAGSRDSSPNGAPLQLVVLTYPCETAARLLAHLQLSGFGVRAVVLQRRGAIANLCRVWRLVSWRRTAHLGFRKVAALLMPSKGEQWRRDDFYRQHAGEVVVVDDLNGSECRDALCRLRPDAAIIGGAGLLRKDVFGVPCCGTLNMHPGLLPEYRGLSSVFWAVLEGGEVGATLHFVDEGIDSGPVIARRAMTVLSGDTFGLLRQRMLDANLDMLVEALLVLSRDGHLAATPQNPHAGRTYHVIPSSMRRIAEGRLAALAARSATGNG